MESVEIFLVPWKIAYIDRDFLCVYFCKKITSFFSCDSVHGIFLFWLWLILLEDIFSSDLMKKKNQHRQS